MHGLNPIRSRVEVAEKLQIHETFLTVQGEGPFSGRAAVFMRLTGCCLKCHFCFPGNTWIRMGDGSQRMIKDIAVGDLVAGVNRTIDETSPRRVLAVQRSQARELIELRLANTGSPYDLLICTPDHPIAMEDGSWQEAGNIKLMELIRRGSEVRPLIGRSPFTSAQPVDVFNLTVEGVHNYIANEVLVHNCDTVWDDDKDPYYTPKQIAELAREEALNAGHTIPKLAVITGGEPTNWPLEDLCRELYNEGFTDIQIETAGVRWDTAFYLTYVTVVVSPKTPRIDAQLYVPHDRVYFKYPLAAGEIDEADGLPLTNTQALTRKDGTPARKQRLARPDWQFQYPGRVFVTPIATDDEEVNARNREQVARSAISFGYTAQLQIHKFMDLR